MAAAMAVAQESDLLSEEQWKLQHQNMHAKHHGCESMHMEMVLVLIATLVVAQIVLVQRKQRHCQLYNLVYKWFLLICKPSYAIGIVGYLAIMFTMFGLNLFFSEIAPGWSLHHPLQHMKPLLRCVAFYNISGIPTRNLSNDICAVCGQKISVDLNEEGITENTYQLSYNHVWERTRIVWTTFGLALLSGGLATGCYRHCPTH